MLMFRVRAQVAQSWQLGCIYETMQTLLTCEAGVEAGSVAVPDVHENVCQRLAVCVRYLNAQQQRDSDLVLGDVAAEHDIVQPVGTLLQFSSQCASSLRAWGRRLRSTPSSQ